MRWGRGIAFKRHVHAQHTRALEPHTIHQHIQGDKVQHTSDVQDHCHGHDVSMSTPLPLMTRQRLAVRQLEERLMSRKGPSRIFRKGQRRPRSLLSSLTALTLRRTSDLDNHLGRNYSHSGCQESHLAAASPALSHRTFSVFSSSTAAAAAAAGFA